MILPREYLFINGIFLDLYLLKNSLVSGIKLQVLILQFTVPIGQSVELIFETPQTCLLPGSISTLCFSVLTLSLLLNSQVTGIHC
jgi:hypothetical protein